MIAAIIQARLGSSRLPGKTLADIAERPVLEHVLDRVRHIDRVGRIIIATTENPQDEPIVRFAEENRLPVYRGSEVDVLDRYYRAAAEFGVDTIVRVTPDDPLKDPEVAGKVLDHFLDERPDYASNTIEPTFPEGLDIEVFSFSALEKAWLEAALPSEREHVTPYIWKNADLFRLVSVVNDRNLSGLRWTLDYREDLEFFRAIFARLYRPGEIFLMGDVLALLEREPWLSEINAGVARQAGYLQSLKMDQEIGAE